MSYRPSQEFDPITWTGDIQPAAQVKKAQKSAQKKAQKGAQKKNG